jgi:hypothetical protein
MAAVAASTRKADADQHRQQGADRDGRGRQQRGGVEQHADRDEEQRGEDPLQRHGLGGGLVAKVALAQQHAGEEGAEGEGDAEDLRGGEGDAEGGDHHAEGEQLAGAAAGDAAQRPGQRPAAEQEDAGDKGDQLGQRP